MQRRWIIALLSGLFTTTWAMPSWAETVLERVARTGVLNAGTRTDSFPFAYVNDEGEWVGYSIDLLDQIHTQLEEHLDQEIELNLVEVSPNTRFSAIRQEEADIVCESISFTSSRARYVDFSIGFFRTGTQFLVSRSNGSTRSNLRIGVIGGTTNANIVEGYLRAAQFITFDHGVDGLEALQVGRIDAFASDGVLLEGLRQLSGNPDDFEVIPSAPIQPEVYGCIVPKDNPDFLELVNRSLLDFMQGVLNNDSQDVAILNTWFGDTGVVPIESEQILDFFRQAIATYQQRNEDAEETPVDEQIDENNKENNELENELENEFQNELNTVIENQLQEE